MNEQIIINSVNYVIKFVNDKCLIYKIKIVKIDIKENDNIFYITIYVKQQFEIKELYRYLSRLIRNKIRTEFIKKNILFKKIYVKIINKYYEL